MNKKYIPKFYGLRIYFSAVILFFFLALPFIGFIAYQQIPSILEKNSGQVDRALAMSDSVKVALDSIPDLDDQVVIDSLVNTYIQEAIDMSELEEEEQEPRIIVSRSNSGDDDAEAGSIDENGNIKLFGDKGPFATYFILLFLLLLVSLIAGYIYNRPFKRFFHLKRLGKEIPAKLLSYCKKQLLLTPLVNSLIISMPNMVVLVYSFVALLQFDRYEVDMEQHMFLELFFLTVIASLLEFLFVYFWQKHRVHIRYIDQVFSPDELRKQIFKRKKGRIRSRLAMSSGVTTFLPLLIVLVYMFLSFTSVRKLNQEVFSKEQREILIGPWATFTNNDKDEVPVEDYKNLFYVNAVDSIVMLVGIGNGIVVSFIYLLLFVRWTNRDITWPVNELLRHIKDTRAGIEEQYTIVRTNDEIGELAEGYNEMIVQIRQHVLHIETMNRELEDKVKERTREVVEQKEEIETQKEEIEAQLDLTTEQRDTISHQNEQILDSIHYARRIQSALIPPTRLLSEKLSDHFVLFRPRDIVSGDFYWIAEKGKSLVVAVADCTGHGVPGAFLSTLGISSLNQIVSGSRSLEPSKILEELRKIVIQSLHQTGSKGETQDGIEIALVVIDTEKMQLEYAGANRPMYLIRGEELEHLRPDRMPIGIYDYELRPFTTHRRTLKKNDRIYLFSDGYVDQMGGEKRKTFRAVNFRKLLLETGDIPMEMQKEKLTENLENWQGKEEQIDDILVMGLKI